MKQLYVITIIMCYLLLFQLNNIFSATLPALYFRVLELFGSNTLRRIPFYI